MVIVVDCVNFGKKNCLLLSAYCLCVVVSCREAMAHTSLLNMPDRVEWKHCTSSKSQETEYASSFRQKFKKFDFSLDQ